MSYQQHKSLDKNLICKKCGGDRIRFKAETYTKDDGSVSIYHIPVCKDCAAKSKREREAKRRIVEDRVCKHCKVDFTPVNYQQVFCSSKCNRSWWNDNKHCKDTHPDWEKHKKGRREYYNNVLSKDQDFMLISRLRGRIYNAMKRKAKASTTKGLIGCSVSELKIHLQKTAIGNGYLGFDIETYDSGLYHVDHVKPCYMFDLTKEEELKQCFHYTNLQILEAHENLVKNKFVA